MEEILNELNKISEDLTAIKHTLSIYEAERNFEDWIPRKKLMDFLQYKDTQMAALLNSGELRVAEIGKRKFIKRDSVLKYLEKRTK